MSDRQRDLARVQVMRIAAAALGGEVPPGIAERASVAGEALVARSGDRIVGVAASTPARSGRDLLAWWVDPEMRDRGVGGTLLRSVLGEAAPGPVQIADSDDDDVNAIFAAYGFERRADEGLWRSPSGVIRQAARAVVTDSDGRFVLVRFEIGGVRFWNLPGGGIETGETTRAALVRELHEELGFILPEAAIGPLAWHYLHWWTHYRGKVVKADAQLERVHLVSAPTREIDPAIGWEGLGSEWVIDIEWWTLEAMSATTERFAAADLPTRIAAALPMSHEPVDGDSRSPSGIEETY